MQPQKSVSSQILPESKPGSSSRTSTNLPNDESSQRAYDLETVVTELKRAKEQLERAQEMAQIGDGVYFPQSGLRLWSKQTFCLYGFKPRDKAPSDAEILAAIHPSDLRSHRKTIERTLFTPDPEREIDFRVIHSDGSQHWLRIVSLVEKNKGDGNDSVVSTIQDITRQKAAESEMLNLIEKERELGKLKTDFLNMITHEYRTPLGIINSSADILARYHDRIEETDRLRHIDDIKHSARRLADLVEEVLFLGKSESGKMVVNLRPVDYGALLRDVSQSIVKEFGFPRDVEIEDRLSKNGCQSDEQLLRHILNNAISNALKYSTLDKPVHILIEDADDGVSLSIKDQGIGIPDTDLKKIFTMFHRASNVGTISGTGLGLVILKRCVDHLKGSLSLDSQINAGTTLAIWLPDNISS